MGRIHSVKLGIGKGNWLRNAAVLLFAVLAVVIAVTLCAPGAQAANDTGLYALTVTNGVNSTDLSSKIGFIRIKYTAADDSETHYEYIFPADGDYAKSLQTAKQLGDDTGNAQLQQLGYAAAGTEQSLFADYAECTLLFTPLREIASVQGVEIYAKSSGTWSCQNMQIYRVDKSTVHLTTCGTYSSQEYIDFSGTLLLQLENAANLKLTTSSLLKITTDSTSPSMSAPSTDTTREAGKSNYIFRIDIADLYGAGIEQEASNQVTNIANQGFFESLGLKIRYLDTWDRTREVTIPVITSVLAQAMNSDGVSSGNIAGVAQQGDTLAFTAFLPAFRELQSTQVIYGYDQVLSAAGLSYNGNKSAHASRVSAAASAGKKEVLSLTGISIYSAEEAALSTQLTDGFLRQTITGSPIYYYRSTKYTGTDFTYGNSTRIAFQEYQNGVSLVPPNQTERYLVVLKTDIPDTAGTTGSLRLKLKFKDLSGSQRETKTMVLSEQCREYYGYWAGVKEDFAYLANVQSGKQLYFTVELSNVDYFDGAEISLDSQSDDWQMSGIAIYKLTKLGQRSAEAESVTVGSQTSNWQYSRSGSEMGDAILNINQSILIQAGETHTMDIRSNSTIEDSTEDDDWSDIRYSMSYSQAKNLGSFIKGRQNYTVTVKVAGDLVTDSDNGDCGSKNLFYFQLVFENGSSAYVLANQQLSADGFRTGENETFSISTNHDYGALTAVRIVPDDEDTKGDVFDKLNVESITVTKDSTDAVSRQWVVSDVGWIEIDYRDEAENTRGKTSRSEEELARTFSVSYSTNVVNLEVALATGSYGTDPQLQGEITGVLTYRDTTGQTQEKTINLVRSMYEYMNRTATDTSDTTYMFRGDHTDRFIVSINNPGEILSLRLTVNSAVQTTWNIENVSVKMASRSSVLQINLNDEYERISDEETVNICEQDSTKTPAYSQLCTVGQAQVVNISFTENQISIAEDETGTNVSVVSRTPKSLEDTLNLYVYMAESADDLSTYTMKAAARYTKVYGGAYQASATLIADAGSRMFYAKGLNAASMSTLNSLYLKAEENGTKSNPSAKVDYAIVQRVRSGVVIETYYMAFGSEATFGTSMKPDSVSETGSGEQVVSLAFGSDTSTVQLFSEKYDVAVAIRYTSYNDPAGAETEYRSPYIFLTDQQVNSLKAGKIVDITFDQSYVKEVTGVTLTTTVTSNSRAVETGQAKEVKLTVDSAVVGTYQVATELVSTADPETQQITETQQEVRTCTGWYSFSGSITLSAAEQTMTRTSAADSGEGTVSQLTLKLATAQASESSNSGHGGAIAMTIGYTDYYGASREVYYDDIRSYLTSGDFSDGSTAVAKFQISNISSVRWISFKPRSTDESGTAVWKLASLSGTLKAGDSETTFSRALDRIFKESEEGKVSLNIEVALTARTVSAASGNETVCNAANSTASLLAESGQPVTIDVSVSGSDNGYSVSAEEYAVETDAGKNVDNYLTVGGSTIIFTPPANYSGTNINYRVIVSSQEVPACQSVIIVTVQYTTQSADEAGSSSTGDTATDTPENTESSQDGA